MFEKINQLIIRNVIHSKKKKKVFHYDIRGMGEGWRNVYDYVMLNY